MTMTFVPSNETPAIVARVLERLSHAVQQTDTTWRTDCPLLHETGDVSHEAALFVAYTTAGNVRLECRGECTVEHILDEIGLKFGDLFANGIQDSEVALAENEPAPPVDPNAPAVLPRAIRAIDAPPSKPIEWVVNDLFTAGEIGLLVGDGGSFKSTAAINMAGAIAGGYPVWNRHTAPQRPSLIISAEDSLDIVMMRLNAFVAGHEWDRTKVLSNVHLFATTDVSLASMSWQRHILDEAKRIGAGMIVLDPFAELINGDENSNSEVRPTVKFLRALGRETGAAVVVVHHAGKQGQDKRTLDRIRGASALPSAARSILFFDYQPNGAGVSVEHLKMSRSPRLERFMLARHVDADSVNRAQWFNASLKHLDIKAAQENRAENFIIAQITASPRQLTTTDLRAIGKKQKLTIEEIGMALNTLKQIGRIDFENGARGAKKWYPVGTSEKQLDLVREV